MNSVKDFIKIQVKEIAFKNVNETDSLLKSGFLDSITVVDLAVALENEYSIKIPFTEIGVENFDSVNLIADFLTAKGVSI